MCVTDGMTYWIVNEEDEAPPKDMWRSSYHQAGASDIEATAYVLLTYTHTGNILKAIDVASWLIKQRNPNGGFSSTQVRLNYISTGSIPCAATQLEACRQGEHPLFSHSARHLYYT